MKLRGDLNSHRSAQSPGADKGSSGQWREKLNRYQQAVGKQNRATWKSTFLWPFITICGLIGQIPGSDALALSYRVTDSDIPRVLAKAHKDVADIISVSYFLIRL